MTFAFDGIHLAIFGGDFTIYYYGIIMMIATMTGGWLASREVARLGRDPEVVWDALIWMVVAAIIGARLWHVLTPPPSSIAVGITTEYYFNNPIELINLRGGGLGIVGGVVGGVIALLLYTRRDKTLSFAQWVDIAAPSLALGQAIGRWGNYFNQELYGAPTDLPWKLYIDPEHRVQGFLNFEYYHPLFLYESLWNLANMFLLLWVRRKFQDVLKPGDLFLVYLITYPLGRFLLEFLRLDASQLFGVNANQGLMVIIAILSALTLFLRHRKPGAPANSIVESPNP